MSYLLIITFILSGVHESRLQVLPDATACVEQADAAKVKASTVSGEWRLKTMCVPIPETTEV